MRIKILNKNKINPLGNYNYENIKSYPIDEGFVYTQNYNETLDSANIRISNLNEEIEIEPYDEVVLYDDERFSENIYLCVDSYTLTHNSLGNDKTFNYEISLFSQTKLLEGIILPNLSITPLKENKRSIAFYLNEYLNEYGEKVRYNDGISANNHIGNRYVLFDDGTSEHLSVFDKFNNECPEMQWNAPTLREVLTDLMMINDCIPVLKNGVIDYIDLTETKNEIDEYNYIRTSQSSSDYISEIKMNLQNVLQTSIDKVKNTIKTTELIPYTCENYLLTTDNVVIKTKHPILEIKSLKMKIITIVMAGLTPYLKNYELDLMNIDGYSLVKENDEYSTLKVLRRYPSQYWENTGDYFSQYQNYCLKYTRGSNEITTFNDLLKGHTGTTQFTKREVLETIFTEYAEREHANIATDYSFYQIMYEVEYTTNSTQTFSAGKNDINNNYKQIVDNQTNSWVDAYNQGKLEYQKANRLGNKQIMINKRIENNSQQLVRIGDYLNDYIVYQCQYQIYKEHIEINAYATKHYILKDYFTGINSKIRTWINAQNEAFKKELLFKEYCEFSKREINEYETLSHNTAYYLLDCFQNTNIETINNAVVRIDNLPNTSDYYILDTLTRLIGNSLVIKCGFEDNAIVGKHYNIDLEDVELDLSTYSVKVKIRDEETNAIVGLENYYYTDENIEAGVFNIKLVKKAIMKPELTDEILPDEDYDLFKERYYNQFKLPLIKAESISDTITDPNAVVYSRQIESIKDNKEIPTFTFQFEFCTEDRSIYFTKYFLKNNASVRNTNRGVLRVYLSDEYNYSKETKPIDSELLNGAIITIGTTSNSSASLTITNTQEIAKDKALYICDNNDNVLIGFKTDNNSLSHTIYLNILKIRNKNYYYKDALNRLIKGGNI